MSTAKDGLDILAPILITRKDESMECPIKPSEIAVRQPDGTMRVAERVQLQDAGGNVLGEVGPEGGTVTYTGNGHRLVAVAVSRVIADDEFCAENYPVVLPEALW